MNTASPQPALPSAPPKRHGGARRAAGPRKRWTPPASASRRLLSLADTAAYLGMTPWSVRTLVGNGVLPVVKLTRRLLFDQRDLDDLIERSKRAGLTSSDTCSITPYNMVTRSRLRQEIQDLRKRKGLTQQQLAERIGVSRIYISKLEQGDRLSPSLDVLERLAQAFGVRLTIELGPSTPARRAKGSGKTKGGKR